MITTSASTSGGYSKPLHVATQCLLEKKAVLIQRVLPVLLLAGGLCILAQGRAQWRSYAILDGPIWSQKGALGRRGISQADHQTMFEERGIRNWHMWEDEELFQRALYVTAQNTTSSPHPQKISFLFLTKGILPLAPIWERYFKGQEERFSVYIHPADPTKRLGRFPRVFWGAQVPSFPAQWGSAELVDAERRLLANALLDPLNERFVLLSESCIPIRGFSEFYRYLMNTSLSHLNLWNPRNPNADGRWHEGLLPLVPRDKFRKGGQWFEMHRGHARMIVADTKYFNRNMRTLWRQPEEHYMQSLFALMGIEDESNKNSLTEVDWIHIDDPSHPHTFHPPEINAGLFDNFRSLVPHRFFARKFAPETLNHLLALNESVLGY